MSEPRAIIRRKPPRRVESLLQDVSSQEEDQQLAATTTTTSSNNHPPSSKVKREPKEEDEPMTPPPDFSGLVPYRAMPVDELPMIKSMQDVVREFPHMQTNLLTGLPNCEAANNKFAMDMKSLGHSVELKSNSSNRDDNATTLSTAIDTPYQVKQRHLATSSVVPWTQAVFQEKLFRLSVPNWYYKDRTAATEQLVAMNDLSQAKLNELIRNDVVDLPEQCAPLECELLAEAGEWTNLQNQQLLHFPPCVFGLNCLGQRELVGSMKGLDKPCVFMQIMHMEEYRVLLKTGSAPTNLIHRPCVLCARQALGDWVTMLRADRMKGGTLSNNSHSLHNFEDQSNQILQWYRNPRGVPGGYDKNFMLSAEPNEPIIHPIVTLNLAQLQCRVASNGRRYVDQSSILYKPPPAPVPRVGEGLQVF